MKAWGVGSLLVFIHARPTTCVKERSWLRSFRHGKDKGTVTLICLSFRHCTTRLDICFTGASQWSAFLFPFAVSPERVASNEDRSEWGLFQPGCFSVAILRAPVAFSGAGAGCGCGEL